MTSHQVDIAALRKLSYGLAVLTAKDGDKDNGCIINTAIQITSSPTRILIAVNNANYTNEMIRRTGAFNLSILTENAPFSIFEQFGFRSGKDVDKFTEYDSGVRTANGVRYVPEHANSVISGTVTASPVFGTHTLFIADVVEAFPLSDVPAMTYQFYLDHVKPNPKPSLEQQQGFVCTVCGYIHKEETLPEGFICPICKHGVEDFRPL
ncbi:MAG: flavin reductase [Planctomycetaceae bacterium]|nr:flavin reductase [Planctomycetaceae bacterium]